MDLLPRNEYPVKTKYTAVALLLSLTSIGSSCVNENVLVSVNLTPIVARYRLGVGTTFAGLVTVKLDSVIASEHKNKVKQGRVYDLKVRVEGEYSGTISGLAAVRIGNGIVKQILRYPQTGAVNWSSFYAPQSLLNKSPYLSPQPEGISELLNALTTSPLPSITVSTIGTLSVAPVPDNLYVVLEVYLQADVEIN
jgi:hypothetical protein